MLGRTPSLWPSLFEKVIRGFLTVNCHSFLSVVKQAQYYSALSFDVTPDLPLSYNGRSVCPDVEQKGLQSEEPPYLARRADFDPPPGRV
jgi:hypothetical protein